jgi:hypothetical protein
MLNEFRIIVDNYVPFGAEEVHTTTRNVSESPGWLILVFSVPATLTSLLS